LVVVKGDERKVNGLDGIGLMIRQIMADYAGLPDYRTLSLHEIKIFYKFLIPGLKKLEKK
jgi:hypothetical protein